MSNLTYCVEPHEDRWKVTIMGDRNAAYAYPTRDDAIRDALKMAGQAQGDRKVLVPTDDGLGYRSLWTSWKDPSPPPSW